MDREELINKKEVCDMNYTRNEGKFLWKHMEHIENSVKPHIPRLHPNLNFCSNAPSKLTK